MHARDLGPILATLGRSYRWIRILGPELIELESLTTPGRLYRARILRNHDGTIRISPPQLHQETPR